MRHKNRKNRRLEVKRNELHFEIQKRVRMQIVENKKKYKRCRDKKVNEEV